MQRLSGAFTALVIATPVDTGRARGSWSINVDGKLYDLAVDGDPQRRVTEGQFSGKIFITNGTRYIQFLNEGSSPQAQAMFVESVLQRFGLVGNIKVIHNSDKAAV